jgi:hypothetical protein
MEIYRQDQLQAEQAKFPSSLGKIKETERTINRQSEFSKNNISEYEKEDDVEMDTQNLFSSYGSGGGPFGLHWDPPPADFASEEAKM